MRDEDIFTQVLNMTPPWSIDRIALDQTSRRLDVWLGHRPGTLWPCPECEEVGPVRDHAPERTWRHVDCCQMEAYLHARVPRMKCPTHGIRQSPIPWAGPESRFTYQFERWAGSLAEESRINLAATMLGISWDEANGIYLRWSGRKAARKQQRSVALVTG